MVGVEEALAGVADHPLKVTVVPALVHTANYLHIFRAHSGLLSHRSVKAGESIGSPMIIGEPPTQTPFLGGLTAGDCVSGRAVDIERANHGFGFQEVLNHFLYLLIFGTMIFLRVLPCLPKAQ